MILDLTPAVPLKVDWRSVLLELMDWYAFFTW